MNDVVKKTSSRKKIALITGGVILLGSIAAYAGGKAYWRHGDHMGHMIEHVSEDLNLDSTQSAQLESLAQTLLKAKKSMRNGDEIETIVAATNGESLDQSALNALIESKLQNVQSQAPQLIGEIAVFYDGLNTEQQAQVREKLNHVAKRIQSHRHGRDYDHD